MKKNALLIVLCCCLSWLLNAQTSEINHYVNFDYDKDHLTDAAAQSIDSLLRTIPLDFNMYEVHLVGHTDSDGSLKYNLDLSMRRSKTVRKYLASHGFSDNQIVIDGKSFLDPVANNSSDKGKAKNRRVEIRLVAKLNPLQVPTERWIFNAEEGLTYTYERSGTVLRIPPNALQKPDGSLAKGEARLEYREFRDAADFIAFGVTMRYGDGWFNSAGMFEIRVFQGDVPLQLPTYKPMEIQFQLTDTLPDLNFYEYQAQQAAWRELGKINAEESVQEYRTQNTPDKKEVRQNCFVPFVSTIPTKPIKDTLQSFFDAMQLASQLAHRPGALTELYKTGFIDFDPRWKRSSNYKNFFYAGTEYTGKANYFDLINNKKYYGVQLKAQGKVDAKTKKVVFDIRDVGNNHPELRTLKDRLFEFDTRMAGTTRTYMFLSNWCDARLEHQGGANFKLTIKGRDKYTEMDIVAQLEGKEKATAAEVYKNIASKYESALNRCRRAFDDSIAFARENWGYFLTYAKTLMPANEQCMSLGEWVQYFENNISKMQSRYDSLWQLPFNSSTLYMVKKAMGQLPISPTLEPVSPVEVPPLVRVLSIDGFGVFNCDQIQRLGNAKQLVAMYADEKGNKIEAESLSLVDYSLNSVLTFPPNQIAYNPSSRTALLVVGKDGNKYLLRSDAFAKLPLKNEKSYTFQMENITASLKSVDDLRKVLSL